MAANYTDGQVEYMVETYTNTPTRQTVDHLAKKMEKSVKSIIGKLSREGVYQKTIYKTKSGEVPKTKQEIILDIAEVLSIDSSKIMGLEKAPKQDIKFIHEVVNKLVQEKDNG